MAEISHEGLALLDADGRFAFASDRTAASLGAAGDDLVGLELARAVPELSAAERAEIESSAKSGETTRLMCTRRAPDGGIRALRLTFVPRRGDDGGPGGMIMLTHDITPLRVVQDQRRRAQHRLTAVEDEEQRRITGDVHDGPIQILAALVLRLGMASSSGIGRAELRDLEIEVNAAGRELRDIVTAPTPADASPHSLLRQWAAPLIDETDLDLEVIDRAARPPNRATTEALFVFLHAAIKGALPTTVRRTIRAVLSEARGGHQLVLSIPQGDARRPEQGEPAGDLADRRYAALLGGSYERETERDMVTITAVLPPLDEHGWSASPPTTTGVPDRGGAGPRGGRVIPDAVTLSDADLEAIAQASYHGLLELDALLRVAYVNDSYARSAGRPAAELIGLDFEDLFPPEDYERLRPHVEQVLAGMPVRFEWRRRHVGGQPRWVQVAGSPRVDLAGRFDGVLLVTLDTTELHVAEDLRDAVLDDLDNARRAARRRAAARLDAGPLRRLEGVRDKVAGLVVDTPHDDAISVIHAELESLIAALRTSIRRLADPAMAEPAWGVVLRSSLTELLPPGDVELTIDDRTARAPRGANAGNLVEIACEEVARAVRDRRAERVTVRLDDTADRYRMQITDDGVGVDPAGVRPAPGRLGTRSTRERAAEQHGTFAVEPRPGGGSIVTVSIPRAAVTIVAT